MKRFAIAAALGAACASTAPRELPARWIDGTDPAEPAFQVHDYGDGVVILRQSVRTDFEAPFLYLIVGERRALLVDTGAGGVPLRATVDALLAERGVAELVVAHSHAHGDHVAGDEELAARPHTTVVGLAPADVARAFGIAHWPLDRGSIDLGGRVVEVVPIPGHEASSVAFYDRRTELLLTGDTLYPGRLYVRDFPAFRASVDRLCELVRERPVRWILGAHIEMTATPGVDFAMNAQTHPHERRLELELAHLFELRDVLHAMGNEPERVVRDDFIVFPLR